MRLWSLHPRYLDRRALVAVWREGLLAQAVLRGETRGYKAHPQLQRFRESGAPVATLAEYMRGVLAEAGRRGYAFDGGKLPRRRGPSKPMTVTHEQVAFELDHLRRKVTLRDPQWLRMLPARSASAHPSFRIVRGGVESWERGNVEAQ